MRAKKLVVVVRSNYFIVIDLEVESSYYKLLLWLINFFVPFTFNWSVDYLSSLKHWIKLLGEKDEILLLG